LKHAEHSDNLANVRIRLPDEVIRILDDLVGRGLFTSRSEAIREFAREYVIEHGRQGG
jgi:Arc/MetJ-type ribon-helix-helix transcriptional regulator